MQTSSSASSAANSSASSAANSFTRLHEIFVKSEAVNWPEIRAISLLTAPLEVIQGRKYVGLYLEACVFRVFQDLCFLRLSDISVYQCLSAFFVFLYMQNHIF